MHSLCLPHGTQHTLWILTISHKEQSSVKAKTQHPKRQKTAWWTHTLKHTLLTSQVGTSCTANANADLVLNTHHFIICNLFTMPY